VFPLILTSEASRPNISEFDPGGPEEGQEGESNESLCFCMDFP
jgi:hypothetical protein